MLLDTDYSNLVNWALRHGGTIGMRRHPKTRDNWDRPARGHHRLSIKQQKDLKK